MSRQFTAHATREFRRTESDKYSSSERLVLPNDLIDGLHICFDAGMKAEQITAVLLLALGVFKMGDCSTFDLIARVKTVLEVIEQDRILIAKSGLSCEDDDLESVF
jgi:hypothetical protein